MSQEIHFSFYLVVGDNFPARKLSSSSGTVCGKLRNRDRASSFINMYRYNSSKVSFATRYFQVREVREKTEEFYCHLTGGKCHRQNGVGHHFLLCQDTWKRSNRTNNKMKRKL